MNREQNIAVFGGTFDPPTRAHEAIIESCLQRQDIDEVWLLPSGQRTDKNGMTSDDVRLAMLQHLQERVFLNDQRVVVSDFELQLPRPTQTWITAQALSDAYPSLHFWYVFGADSYESMDTWEHGETLKQTIGMLLIPRAGFCMPTQTPKLRHLSVSIATQGISSTEAREALKNGENTDHLLSRPIQEFVAERALYGALQ